MVAYAGSAVSSYAAGGGGIVLEHEYGAVLLACLLTGDPVPRLGDEVTPTVVRFQASAVSPVDDLLVSGQTPDGGIRRASVGVRRAPKLTRSEKNSVPLIQSYLDVVIGSWEEVWAGRWRLVLAAARSDNAVTQAGDLAEFARANSKGEAEFRTELQHGVHRRDLRKRLVHLDALVAAAVTQRIDARAVQPGELTWRFLFSLRVLPLRLQSPDATDRTGTVRMLRPFTKDGTAAAADDLFNRLAGLARHYAPVGATVTKADLMRDLSGWPLADPSSHRRAPWVTGQPAVRASARRQEPAIDTTVAHSARVWNCWLGGKDNNPVDRVTAEQYSTIFPGITASAEACRAFLVRAVRYLAGEAGIRQFLDIGVGLPVTGSTHEVAQQIAPESRIVYADNDPLSLAHARALLTSRAPGPVGYVEADLHEPGELMNKAAKTLDCTQPIAILLLHTVGHITDDGEARSIVARLLRSVPSGSYLVLSDGTNAVNGPAAEDAQRGYNLSGAAPYCLRSPGQLALILDGLDLVEPGLVSCSRWRPEPAPSGLQAEVGEFCAVGRKP